MTATYTTGTYLAEIREQGFEEAGTGTPYFILVVNILGRYDQQGQLQECPRFERYVRFYLNRDNDTGVNILRGALRTLGVNVQALEQLDPSTTGAIILVGKTIDVACELDTYRGRPVERWSLPRSRNRLQQQAVRTLGDRFNHLLRNGNAATSPGPTPAPAPNESDTPF
jgi:hypothetical protein